MSGRIVPERNDQSMRELVMGNYRIIYQVDTESDVRILTVHHGRRLLSNNRTFGEADS
ncbi:MAG: type II toxin-antitoxin system RelE/ParE family toxin [Bacteroidota bacterium]